MTSLTSQLLTAGGVMNPSTTPECGNLAEWQVMGPKALKGGHGERLRHRKEPQQARLAQGKQVMRSPAGANFLHS